MCIRSGSFAKLLRRPVHDFLQCTLCVTQGHWIEGIRPTGPPVRGVTSTSNPALCDPVPFAVTAAASFLQTPFSTYVL